jgi:hypothetical protein
MVEVFVIYIESVETGNKGFLSRQTGKESDGSIRVEFLREIQDTNPKADICMAVAYFTRGSAIKAKDLVLSEIINKHPDATVNAEVQSKQISLADSRRMNNATWVYK